MQSVSGGARIVKALTGFVTPAQVAELRGTHRVAAYRWLLRNCKKDIRYIGRFCVVSEGAYRRAALAEHIDDKFAKLDARLADVETGTTEHGRRMTALVQRISRIESRLAS
jgi:hypothetical protein